MPIILFTLAILSLLLFILSYTKLNIKQILDFFFFKDKIVIALINFNCIKWRLENMINEVKKTII